MTDFDHFFHDTFDYPDPCAHDLTQRGWRFNYISNTFLNGWINYVEPVRAFVLSRYNENFETVKAKLAEWKAKPPYHTDLGELDDDVYVLAKDKSGRFWCFEFDCDVSDCSLGVPDVGGATDDQVIATFDMHVQARARGHVRGYGGTGEAEEIPVALLGGWVKFK